MRESLSRGALVVFAGLLLAGNAAAQHERRTAVVEAVDKTKGGIVTLKASKSNDRGKRGVVGTGVMVDERGYLITNHHVVNGATRVRAILADGSVVEAAVYAELPQYDLAVLSLPESEKKYKALVLGAGRDIMVGETVIVVGNPHGYANSVCTGIVSALGREITMPSNEVLKNLVQHNSAINPGNSGGPLLNINGEVIGINVALREGSQGISFAINVDTVKDALRKHLSAAKVSNIVHGLKTEEQVEATGEGRQKVVVVGAADESVQKGDVIVKAGVTKVNNRFDLERAMWGYKDGEKIELRVKREGKEVKLSVTLGARPVSSRRASR